MSGRGERPPDRAGYDFYEDDEHDWGDGRYEPVHADDSDHGYYAESPHGHDPQYDEAGWPVVEDVRPPDGRGRGGGSGRGRRGGRRRGRLEHPVLTAVGIILLIILIVAGSGLAWAYKQIDPGGKRGALVSVVIPKGASTSQIGSRLAAAGVIHTSWLFAYYVHFHGYTLLPGTYQLHRNSPYSSAISALQAGPTVLTDKLVIPEGFTIAQIAHAVAALPHMGLSAQKFIAAATNGSVTSPYEPAGVKDLEGLLFPDTYQVRQGETEVDILEEMVGTFDDQAQSLGLTAAAARHGITPYQLVTVASIVEKEAKLAADRPNVASTIYNRLRIGMKLGADSTQTYYLRLTDPTIQPTGAQYDQPSPYNTRVNPGLPPTPIADPGLASLEAAANPPSTKYLYWVEINPDGQLGFASDNAGFVQLQHQCRVAGLC